MVYVVAIMVCGHHGIPCSRHGLWPSWYTLWQSWFVTIMVYLVAVMVCGRHGIPGGHHDLWPSWYKPPHTDLSSRGSCRYLSVNRTVSFFDRTPPMTSTSTAMYVCLMSPTQLVYCAYKHTVCCQLLVSVSFLTSRLFPLFTSDACQMIDYWLRGVVVRASDLRSRDREFDSRPVY